jgi:hypothetical protein
MTFGGNDFNQLAIWSPVGSSSKVIIKNINEEGGCFRFEKPVASGWGSGLNTILF